MAFTPILRCCYAKIGPSPIQYELKLVLKQLFVPFEASVSLEYAFTLASTQLAQSRHSFQHLWQCLLHRLHEMFSVRACNHWFLF